jgi:hypothetical protein
MPISKYEGYLSDPLTTSGSTPGAGEVPAVVDSIEEENGGIVVQELTTDKLGS